MANRLWVGQNRLIANTVMTALVVKCILIFNKFKNNKLQIFF